MFGNDVGHMSHKEIQTAFQGVLSQKQIDLLKSVSGMKGSNAYYNGLPKVKYLISVEYSDAEKVFKKYTLPKFTQQTATAFKLSKDRLHPHSGGALTSIVFNRGPSMSSSSSRKEMRDIRQNISLKKDDAIPSDIRSMKRLWSYKSLKGLHLRRDAEAKLFQEGLDARK
jgi:GH24 family phage-related lysozyme (muramidase)